MIAEMMTAITSGGLTSNHHRERRQGQGSGTCHAFIVIDPAIFGDAQAMKGRLSALLEELRSAQRADENIPIYTHGDSPAPLPPQGMIVQPEMHLPHPGKLCTSVCF